jgi:hypothetical protein
MCKMPEFYNEIIFYNKVVEMEKTIRLVISEMSILRIPVGIKKMAVTNCKYCK